MSNTLDGGSFKEEWAREMQIKLDKKDVFRAICNWEGQDQLSEGDVFNKSYRSNVITKAYTRGTAFTPQDLTNTNESLTINVTRIAPFYIDDLDKLQSSYKLQELYGSDCVVQLNNWLDGDVLGEYDQAASGNSVDQGDHGGTDDVAFTLTTSNVLKTFTTAKRKLDHQNVPQDKRFFIISPEIYQVLLEYVGGKESAFGDSINRNGHVGKFMGFQLFVSNSLTGEARLEVGTNPSDGETITIEGVTFTYESGTIDTAGEVDIGGSAAVSIDNLIACIDKTGTSGTEYYDLSDANQGIVDRWTMTDGSSYLVVKGEGAGYLVVSETLSATADIWTANKQIQYALAGQIGAIHAIVQSKPKINVRPVSDKLGVNVCPHILYGIKTFNEGTKKIVKCLVRSDGF